MDTGRTDIHRTIDAVWRIEAAKLIGGLTRITRDVAQAEELAQDALEAALRQWPESGIPDKPGAWLMQSAKNRAIDGIRRRAMQQKKHVEIGHELAAKYRTQPGDLRRRAGRPLCVVWHHGNRFIEHGALWPFTDVSAVAVPRPHDVAELRPKSAA